MQSYTRRSSTLGWQGVLWGQPTLGVALLATCLLLVGTAGASAAYVDSFNSAPFTGVVTSFTTGSSSTGVSYTISGGDGGDFAWRSNGGDGGSGTIDILSDAVSAAVEKVTIESRDGKAFVFTSLWCDVMGDGWTIKGEGPEPFTMTAGTGTSATKSPSGGAKLVTSIEITSTDFYDDYLDTVTLQLDVPGAAVYGEGRLITNGDSTPSSTNGTDLGETPVGTPVTQDFELENIGDAALTVDSSVTVTGAGFSIAQQPSSPIASGGSSTFTVQFDPSSSGTVTGTVTIDNNSEADDYTFSVTGEGTADTDPPGLTAFERQTPSTQDTNADSLVFRATFDEDVQYVTTGDFAVTGTSATVTDVNAVSAAVYDLTVSGGDLADYDGTVGLDLSGTQNIADLWDNALPSGDPGTDETYQMDNTSPTDPTPTSSSHTVSVWNNDATIDIQISGASDAGSGVDGFEVEWDQSATWTPNKSKEQEEAWAGATFTATSDGDWYFHIATVDNVGNWTSTEHLGPFQIDTTSPSVPTGLDPADGSYTTETSPILSWNASTDTGGSGIRDTSAYRIVVTGPSGRDTYVSDTDYNPTDLDEGTYTWRLYARDNAGNSSSYTADTTLVIDATQPDVTLDQAAGQADPTNASPLVFTAVFDEPIDDATFTNADVSVGGTATTGTVTVTEVLPHDDTTFEVSIVATADGTVVPTIPAGGIEDYAGNTNTASTSSDNSVTYDGSKPSVTIDQAAAQADPATSSPVLFTVVFDEPIDDGTFTNADVSVDGTATTGTVTVTEVAPNDDTTFEVSVVVTGDGTVVSTIPAGGVEDPFGNTNDPSTSTDNSVTVDTDPPGLVSVTPNSANDADVGVVSVSITFDEPMDVGTNPNPTITGLGTDPYTITGSAWSNGDQTWTGSFTLVDDEEVATGTYNVSGFKDAAGNTMVANSAKSIEVDTDNPSVLSVDASDPLLVESDAGGTFTVTVVFDKSMDTGAVPSVVFNPDLTPGTLAAGAGNWSQTTELNDTYSIDYAITDADAEDDSVFVDVTGAQDANGNAQSDYTALDEFGIDMRKPTATSIVVSDTWIDDLDIGDTFVVTVTFSEPMDMTSDPWVAFAPNVNSTLSLTTEVWVSPTLLEVSHTILDADTVVMDVDASIHGCDDVNGNMIAGDFGAPSDFSIDTLNPPPGTLPTIVVTPAGAAGEGAFLDRCLDLGEDEEPPMIGLCPLSAIYEIGEQITGRCLLWDEDGRPLRGAYVHIYVYSVDPYTHPEVLTLIDHWTIHYDGDCGGYCFLWDSSERVPGYYDVRLSFPDASTHTCRIQLIEPEKP